MKRVRATNTWFEKAGGIQCAVITCEDGTEVIFPAEAFLVLASKARQHLNSTNTPLKTGEWVAARYQHVDEIRTGSTGTGRVALQLNPGTDSEICISLAPETAHDLGRALVDESSPNLSLNQSH